MSNHQRNGSVAGDVTPVTVLATVRSAAPHLDLRMAKPLLYEERRPVREPMLLRNHPTKVQILYWEAVLIGNAVMPLKLVSCAIVDLAVSH